MGEMGTTLTDSDPDKACITVKSQYCPSLITGHSPYFFNFSLIFYAYHNNLNTIHLEPCLELDLL